MIETEEARATMEGEELVIGPIRARWLSHIDRANKAHYTKRTFELHVEYRYGKFRASIHRLTGDGYKLQTRATERRAHLAARGALASFGKPKETRELEERFEVELRELEQR